MPPHCLLLLGLDLIGCETEAAKERVVTFSCKSTGLMLVHNTISCSTLSIIMQVPSVPNVL